MKYKVCLSTKANPKKLSKASENYILVIEPDDYTDAEVKAIKAKGYKLLGYLSVGTIEKERFWYSKYKAYRLQRLEDWPNEYYIDIREKAWQDFLIQRAKKLKKIGYSGLWCDNLDVYEYNKSLEGMYSACKKVLGELKNLGLYIMVNGGSEFFGKAMDRNEKIFNMVHGVTQEEVFSRITSYSGTGKFGVQTSSLNEFYTGYLKRLNKFGIQTFLLEYTRNVALTNKIKNFCSKNGIAGYYISKNVDL